MEAIASRVLTTFGIIVLISITVERALTVFFSLKIVSDLVNKEGKHFSGSDFKVLLTWVVSIIIARAFDLRVIALIAGGEIIVGKTMHWCDWILTGALISMGTNIINNWLRIIISKRKLIEDLAAGKDIENSKS